VNRVGKAFTREREREREREEDGFLAFWFCLFRRGNCRAHVRPVLGSDIETEIVRVIREIS
jgi:hypothetical protein